MVYQKYFFEKDGNGKFINPSTNAAFKRGEIFDGKFFMSHSKNPQFYSEKAFNDQLRRKKMSEYGSNRSKKSIVSRGMANARSRCKIKGGIVDENIRIKFHSALEVGVCQITGIPFQYNTNKTIRSVNPFSPSLDRINNEDRNYSVPNSQIVLAAVNMAKGDLTLEEQKQIIPALARKILEHKDIGIQTD